MLTSRELNTEVGILERVTFEKTAPFRCVYFHYFYSFSSHSLAFRKCSEQEKSCLHLQQDTGKYSDTNSSCGFWDSL